MNCLHVIGDSFAGPAGYVSGYNYDTDYWVNVLSQHMNNIQTNINYAPSRDFQSVIDEWTKLLPYINKSDYLVIIFPTMVRTRLPLDSNEWVTYNYISKNILDNNCDYKTTTRFIGTKSFNPNFHSLEFWGKTYTYEHYVNNLQYQEIINSSEASKYSYLDIIDSLVKMTKCKLYMCTWDSLEYTESYKFLIEDRTKLEYNIKTWETFDDVYKNTNGQTGHKEDIHWSGYMNKLVANYIYNKLSI
jgi:hypothetical protein